MIGAFLVPAGISNHVQPYDVGTAKELKARSRSGDGLDIHDVPQGKPADQVIDGYDYDTAPAIALPGPEHVRIPNERGTCSGTAQELI